MRSRFEAVHRAEVGQYPLIGLDPADVKRHLKASYRDKDEWAAGFMRVADRYFNQAKSLEKSDPTKANADYIRAWRIILSDAGRSFIAGKAAFLRESARGVPGACEVHGPAA